ncbi:MAG: hypothetical protein N0E48_16005 [Candidatus Thiodiazotropha endolucinida]|nr:hypothetical protein [Candidatus Thiodiazotropha taylori]MCW4344835.1 hypothetical protein [Candidatus Thiodiazotropha endolucinida]
MWDDLNPELTEYVESQGWTAIDQPLSALKDLQQEIADGGRYVEIPGDNATADDISKFHSRLGRPAKSEDYTFDLVDGEDRTMYDWFSDAAFQAGLTQNQVATLSSAWRQQVDVERDKSMQQSQEVVNRLKRDMGDKFDTFIEQGRNTVRSLNLNESVVADIEKSLGTGSMLKLMAALGENTSEHAFASGNVRNPTEQNSADAIVKISQMKKDKEFIKRYLNGDTDAVEKMKEAYAVAFPDSNLT